ncbi:hypothetical protein KP806_09800 [Paenibacillus sp. N4]|uniref:hypothetical protein n=1 Tax=Paenibacillus vietnamensis TaxID=2590547 RepID=UPI001CD099A8|nr:hypothetical protein [Paenibacillus vietnamensis]MCA0755344.1 hypothetical protein [Paenibacillus vietnamensis]
MFSGKGRHVLYLLIALAMLAYGLPRLELNATWDATSVFGLVWTLLAFVIVTAHVNALLMKEEKRKELARIKRAKAMYWERRLTEKTAVKRKVRG